MLQVRIYNIYFLTAPWNWKTGLAFELWSAVEIDIKMPSIYISQPPNSQLTVLKSIKYLQHNDQNKVNNGN